MASRREKLEAMLEADPSDQTCRYMLAMECEKNGDIDTCLQHFRHLMSSQEPYVPAFLMAGQLLTRVGQTDAARECFHAGIQQARQQQNEHAAGEMSQFLAELP